jgi:hypothetical protein
VRNQSCAIRVVKDEPLFHPTVALLALELSCHRICYSVCPRDMCLTPPFTRPRRTTMISPNRTVRGSVCNGLLRHGLLRCVRSPRGVDNAHQVPLACRICSPSPRGTCEVRQRVSTD